MFKYHAIIKEDGSLVLPSLRALRGREVIVHIFDAKNEKSTDEQPIGEQLGEIRDCISGIEFDVADISLNIENLTDKLDQLLEKFERQDGEND